jgi:hypothetical protein
MRPRRSKAPTGDPIKPIGRHDRAEGDRMNRKHVLVLAAALLLVPFTGIASAADVERTIWIHNPLRLPLPTTFVFKQIETAHPYSTWNAELIGGECQEVFFVDWLEEELSKRIQDLAKVVRLEKTDEFNSCLDEILAKPAHQRPAALRTFCRAVAEGKQK